MEKKKQKCLRCNCPNNNDHRDICNLEKEYYEECINNADDYGNT